MKIQEIIKKNIIDLETAIDTEGRLTIKIGQDDVGIILRNKKNEETVEWFKFYEFDFMVRSIVRLHLFLTGEWVKPKLK